MTPDSERDATEGLQITGIPFELSWLLEPQSSSIEADSLSITAGPQCDWFTDPGGATPNANAPALLGLPNGDFTLSARVEVGFAGRFDAGVLMLFQDDQTWAKLCFENSPQGVPMVVSVVTRGRSDDCNSTPVQGAAVWLRITRIGDAFAFHASTDGRSWNFVRHFTFGPSGQMKVGFEAQSPVGEGCTVRFSEIRFSSATPTDLRDGS